MINFILFLLYFFTALLMPQIAFAEVKAETEITAYGISSKPFINNIDKRKRKRKRKIKICYLDIYDKKTKQIKEEIKAQKNMTEEEITKKYQKDFEQISNSLLCQYQAKRLGIEKLPAIVFINKDAKGIGVKEVIYGELDITSAIKDYENYEAEKND